MAYFQSLTADTIYCDHQDAEDFVQVYRERQKLQKSRKQVVAEKEEQLEEVSDLEKVKPGTKVLNDGGAMYFPGNSKGGEIKNEDGTFSCPSSVVRKGSTNRQLTSTVALHARPRP